MSEILLKTIAEKSDKQEKKIVEMEKTLKNVPAHSEEIRQVKTEVNQLKTAVTDISFPTQEMRELSRNLTLSVNLLRQPVINKIHHYHHVRIGIFIVVGLCISLIVTGYGWYATGNTLSEYKASDTKYRYLKVFGSNSLKELLYNADSLYRVEPGMRDSVIQKEEGNRQVFELLQEAKRKEEEAKELKRKAKVHK